MQPPIVGFWTGTVPSPSKEGFGGIALPGRPRARTISSEYLQHNPGFSSGLSESGGKSTDPEASQPVPTPSGAAISNPPSTLLPPVHDFPTTDTQRLVNTFLTELPAPGTLRRAPSIDVHPRVEDQVAPPFPDVVTRVEEPSSSAGPTQPLALVEPVQEQPPPLAANASNALKRQHDYDEGPKEDNSKPKPKKKRRNNKFDDVNPAAARQMTVFHGGVSRRPNAKASKASSNAIANTAGSSSAPPQLVPRPSGAELAYPSQQQETSNFHHLSSGHQQPQEPLPFSQSGMQFPGFYTPAFPLVLLQVPSGGIRRKIITIRPARGFIWLPNAVFGPSNTRMAHFSYARFSFEMLTGSKLAERRLSEGPAFFGNELYDPYTLRAWVLRIMVRLPDGGPSTSFQVPNPAPVAGAQSAPEAFYHTQQVSESTVHSSYEDSAWPANHMPVGKMPLDAGNPDPEGPSTAPHPPPTASYTPASYEDPSWTHYMPTSAPVDLGSTGPSIHYPSSITGYAPAWYDDCPSWLADPVLATNAKLAHYLHEYVSACYQSKEHAGNAGMSLDPQFTVPHPHHYSSEIYASASQTFQGLPANYTPPMGFPSAAACTPTPQVTDANFVQPSASYAPFDESLGSAFSQANATPEALSNRSFSAPQVDDPQLMIPHPHHYSSEIYASTSQMVHASSSSYTLSMEYSSSAACAPASQVTNANLMQPSTSCAPFDGSPGNATPEARSFSPSPFESDLSIPAQSAPAPRGVSMADIMGLLLQICEQATAPATDPSQLDTLEETDGNV